jgi:hypothetical protein
MLCMIQNELFLHCLQYHTHNDISWGDTYRWVGHAPPHGVGWSVRGWISAREAGTRGTDRWVQWRLPVHHLLWRIHDDNVHYKDKSLECWVQPWTTSTPPWRTINSNNNILVTNNAAAVINVLFAASVRLRTLWYFATIDAVIRGAER